MEHIRHTKDIIKTLHNGLIFANGSYKSSIISYEPPVKHDFFLNQIKYIDPAFGESPKHKSMTFFLHIHMPEIVLKTIRTVLAYKIVFPPFFNI